MKLIVALLFTTACFAAQNDTKQKDAKNFATKVDTAKPVDKKPEDCDDKAKKQVEIKPEAISLSGNTGCTLEDESH